MQEPQEGQVEVIDLTQLMQALTGEEVQGTPTAEITYPVTKPEQVPGQELAKQRVRVSFEFEVTCNTSPILNSHNDADVKAHDMALLKSFLLTPQMIHMLVDCIGSKLGYHPESFMQEFLPQIDTECHKLFSTAIGRLQDDEFIYWRDIAVAPKLSAYEDLLSICTEQIFECFNAEFVKSSYEVVEDEPRVVHNYLDDEAIKAAKHLQVREK
jgi:hypothetical protein